MGHDVDAVHAHPAFGGGEQAHEHLQTGALARAIVADEADEPTIDGEVDATRYNDKGDADTNDAKERGPANNILQIIGAGKFGFDRPSEQKDGDEQTKNAENFFHIRRFFPWPNA